MHHPGVTCHAQCASDRVNQHERVLHGESTALAQVPGEVVAFEQIHDEERATVAGDAVLVDLDDVRRLERQRHLHLSREAFDVDEALRKERVQHLDCG